MGTEPEDGLRLAEIFTPYAAERFKCLKKNNRKLVHYTSAENAMRILKSKQIWLRDTRCMIDYSEVLHGHDQLVKWFDGDDNRKRFIDEFDYCSVGVARDAIGLFDQWWAHIPENTYISCFCEHDPEEDLYGRLSMWRAFGRGSGGVALVLNLPIEQPVDALSVVLSPVAYFSFPEVAAQLDRVINNVRSERDYLKGLDRQRIAASIFNMLLMASVCLKHKGFKEEQEWRAIHTPKHSPSKLLVAETEVIGGVPQTIFKVTLEDRPDQGVVGLEIPALLHRVIIGPSAFPGPIRDAIVGDLERLGVQDAMTKVFISDIPLRT
jgi:hypothetical protein